MRSPRRRRGCSGHSESEMIMIPINVIIEAQPPFQRQRSPSQRDTRSERRRFAASFSWLKADLRVGRVNPPRSVNPSATRQCRRGGHGRNSADARLRSHAAIEGCGEQGSCLAARAPRRNRRLHNEVSDDGPGLPCFASVFAAHEGTFVKPPTTSATSATPLRSNDDTAIRNARDIESGVADVVAGLLASGSRGDVGVTALNSAAMNKREVMRRSVAEAATTTNGSHQRLSRISCSAQAKAKSTRVKVCSG